MTDTDILSAREARGNHVARLRSKGTVIAIHANIPGAVKQGPIDTFLVSLFARLVSEVFHCTFTYSDSPDGMYATAYVSKRAELLKSQCVTIETMHPLGRLIDLDVHDPNGQWSRETPRTCLICGNDVHICRRSGVHTTQTLTQAIDKMVRTFIRDALAREAINALRKEVFTVPCFALVSHKSSGLHTDMNISHFLTAFDTLETAFKAYLDYALFDDFTLEGLNKMGRTYEQRLLSTVGVNTHKGAHYLFGLLLPVMARSIMSGDSQDGFNKTLKHYGRTLETRARTAPPPYPSSGERAYSDAGIRGVRGELAEGFPSIFAWRTPHTLNWSGTEKLMAIMRRLDDTTLHKKDALTRVKSCLAKHSEPADYSGVRQCTGEVSPGGAADLLAVVYMLEQTDYLFNAAP